MNGKPLQQSKRILIIVAIGLVTALTILLLSTLRESSGGQKPSCISNLRQLDAAKTQWAIDKNKTTNDTPAWEGLRDYFKEVPLKCPNGGDYTIGSLDERPRCSLQKHAMSWGTPNP